MDSEIEVILLAELTKAEAHKAEFLVFLEKHYPTVAMHVANHDLRLWLHKDVRRLIEELENQIADRIFEEGSPN